MKSLEGIYEYMKLCSFQSTDIFFSFYFPIQAFLFKNKIQCAQMIKEWKHSKGYSDQKTQT